MEVSGYMLAIYTALKSIKNCLKQKPPGVYKHKHNVEHLMNRLEGRWSKQKCVDFSSESYKTKSGIMKIDLGEVPCRRGGDSKIPRIRLSKSVT